MKPSHVPQLSPMTVNYWQSTHFRQPLDRPIKLHAFRTVERRVLQMEIMSKWFPNRSKSRRVEVLAGNLSTGVLHLIQINHQPDATIFQFIILTFVYSSTCFGRFPAHHQELNDCSGSL